LNQTGKIFIFIGPPGAGKGSIANLCIKKFGWLQISTGNLCRKHIAEQTKIGKEIALIIKSGKLISDDLISLMVSEWLRGNVGKTSGIIFDGYPRTVAQAKAFDLMLKAICPNMQIHVVSFHLSDDEVVQRLCSRFVCQNKDCQAVYSAVPYSDLAPKQEGICDVCSGQLGRREDDSELSVRKRLEIYHKHEQELTDFYQLSGRDIIKLNAGAQLNDVFDTFVQQVGVHENVVV